MIQHSALSNAYRDAGENLYIPHGRRLALVLLLAKDRYSKATVYRNAERIYRACKTARGRGDRDKKGQ